ncbi:UDP-N-acetylmuramoyl-L-alanine--D-glutamate ligase [Candidatus Gottesmanbacteria bacterium]|nr:UDP-N-acetylmuramoyl-L-alanine--D-glutamate ligase [Candidatus Gottesmanbacteria bacterium]
MKLKSLAEKKICILGYGKEGKATRAFLQTMVPSAIVSISDQKNGPDYLTGLEAYDVVIKTPGIPKHLVPVPFTTATDIFFANTRGYTIGVTGSKGKSTTASLLYAILKKGGKNVHLVGNIGNPMLTALCEEKSSETVYVIELSSYQLDTIAYSPRIALITNLFPEHMDYHGDVQAYWRAKERIVTRSTSDDYLVYNPDYPRLVRLAKITKAKSVPFVARLPFDYTQPHLLGRHNKDNVRAAVTAAGLLDVPPETMEKAVVGFGPLPHRLEYIGTFRNLSFYDDAISTTPESTICAIESFPSVGAILLGGQDRGYDFSRLGTMIAARRIPTVVLFPDSGEAIYKAIIKASYTPLHVLRTKEMGMAVSFVFEHARAHSVCLLSTASPSYSVWENFEKKGELFAQFVRKYSSGL